MSDEYLQMVWGDTRVKLKGLPFVIGCDTFDRTDWFGGYFETNEDALAEAKGKGGPMTIYYAFDGKGKMIGKGGTF